MIAKLDLRGMGDAALAVAIARRRDDALAEAYRRHGGAVYALARRVLGDGTRAEEVVQEVFVRVWQQPERFDPDRGTLRSYLLSMTHGRSVDLVRSEMSRRRREEHDARSTATAAYDLEHEVWDLALAEQVKGALQQLDPDERKAIELAYFGGHSYRQVAELLGHPEGTVKSRIRAGLRTLQGSLAHVSSAGVEQ